MDAIYHPKTEKSRERWGLFHEDEMLALMKGDVTRIYGMLWIEMFDELVKRGINPDDYFLKDKGIT